MLDECIQVYQDFNHYLTETEMADVVALQNALDTRVDSLNAYMQVLTAAGSTPDYATYSAALNKVPASRGWDNHVVDFTEKTDFRGLNGTYFIVGKSHLMDPTATPAADGHIAAVLVTVENKKVVNADVSQAIDLIYEETSDGSDSKCYFFRAQDGNYLRAEIIDSNYTLTWGHAHQSFGFGYITNDNVDRERVFFSRNINYDINGNWLGTNATRLNFDTDKTSFALQKSGGTTNSNYRLYRLTWNTGELLAAITEMLSHTENNGSDVIPGVYQDFLSCMDESIALYLKYNVAHTPEQLGQTVAIQSELKAQVIRLLSYKDILETDYSQVIENLATPYNELYRGPLSRRHSMDIRLVTDGVYYIVHHNSGDTGPDGWAWTPDDDLYVQDANNRIYGAPVEISDAHVVNGQPVMAFHLKKNMKNDDSDSFANSYANEFAPWPVYNTTFYVNKGEFIPNNSKPNALACAYGRQVAFELHVYDDGFTMRCNKNFDGVAGNENYYVQYKPELNGFRPYLMEAIEEEVSLFHLYRVSSQVLDLYNAIQQVAVYATGNKDGRYPANEYKAFIDCLQESINMYQHYNTSLVEGWNEAALKDELDGKAKELLSHIGILTLADTKVNYIDIPTKILDFRADGFMIEYEKGNYGLNSIGDLADFYGKEFANKLKAYNTVTPDGSPSTVAEGLTLPNLVNGNMVYTEATVNQVAHSIMAGLYVQRDNIPNQSNQVKLKADGLSNAAKALITEDKTLSEVMKSDEWKTLLGSPSDTYSKTSTSTVNGGELAWGEIETAYDLAYYILNYLWRPVAGTDKQSNGDIYNVSVPERSVFRMFRDEDTGRYTLDAYKRVEYTDSYVFNAYPITDSYVHEASPNFTPIDGLGFETPNAEGEMAPDTDRSQHLYDSNNYSTNGTNFHFTVHAYGSFVYDKEKNLYFEFLGDDDVYFYIDGQRVMDLGGGHAAASGSLELNAVAKDLGLEDGGAYNFDMFYAERKTSASNLRFETNIQIVSRDGKTSKVQYAHTNDGKDLVDKTTGLGQPVVDHQTINVGEVVAYGFGILNDKDAALINASFRDDSLGVNISPDSLTLCDKDNNFRKNNGVETTINNIRLYYRSHTDGVVTTQAPDELTYDELTELLDQSSAFTGSYFVRIKNETQLRTLLARGIPVGCQMMVYGFLRRTVVEDLNYTNTVNSLCYYVPQGGNTVYPIIGEASCHLRVPENSSLPQVRKLEVVLDYGKAVSVPLTDIRDLIHFEDGSFARVGNVVGFLADGSGSNVYHGMLLKEEPAELRSTAKDPNIEGKQGIFTMEATALSYQPTQFLTQTESVYAVVELHDFYCSENGTGAYSYVVAEITVTPAHVMYYETDFAPDSKLFTMTQVGGQHPQWTNIDDGTGAADPNQDYERINGTVYRTDIAREYIPAEAFFADFDGEGYERRYRDNPQYKGLDFDQSYWATRANGSTTAFAIDNAAGTMSVQVSSDPDSSGNYGPYVATTTTPGTYPGTGMSTLALSPSQEHYIQIRFKVENCTFVDGEVPWVHFLHWYTDPVTGKTMYDEDVGGKDFKTRTMGEYQTLTFPIPANSKFSTADYIRGFGFRFRNIVGTNKSSCVTIDYIYIGPEMGMEDDVYSNYLFVGFDNTPADCLRYGSSIYGANTANKNYRVLDEASAWASSSAGTTVKIQKGTGNDAANGYLYFEDKLDDNTLGDNADKHYNYIHAGSFVDSNDASKGFNLPIAYTPTDNDFCQIRIKIEDGEKVPATAEKKNAVGVGLEYAYGSICGKAELDESYLDGQFHTITIPLDAPKFRREVTSLQWLHPVIYNVKGTGELTTGAKFTIDYIFIGPEHMLDHISQHVNPEAEKANHLFFDFNNNDAAKLRYTNPAYGNTVTNYDLPGKWSVDDKVGDTVIESFDTVAGTITFKDNNDKDWNYIHSAEHYYNTPLAYTPGTNDYLRIRMKINNGTASSERMTISLENFEGDNFFSYGAREYSFADYADGKYHVFTVPLNTEDYLKEDLLTAVRPVISGTKNCSFTVDYIYVGPLTESNPSAPSLYFGFGDRGSGHWNTDRLRYDSDTYGFLNYDTHTWLSESPAVPSSLTDRIYGWNYAGNEDIPESSDPLCPKPLPDESITYPHIGVTPRTDTGHLELSIKNGTQGPIGIQTHPNSGFDYIYWRYYMQKLNYHPGEENIVQVRFKMENLTIGEDFAVKLMYVPAGLNAFCTSEPLHLAPQMPLNPQEDYVTLTAQLDDTFNNAPAIERLRLVFEGVSADNGDAKILIDYVYAGVGRSAPEPVYGYDSSYENDTRLSNGSSPFVNGSGVPKMKQDANKNIVIDYANSTTYTEASFTFTGTGFDIISRTGEKQGALRVCICNEAGTVLKTISVINKGVKELYQIPVVSVDLSKEYGYGTYTVRIFVNAAYDYGKDGNADAFHGDLDRGGEFYFDAIRIYNPNDPHAIDADRAYVQSVYQADCEANPTFEEIRKLLLDAQSFKPDGSTVDGAVYLDWDGAPTLANYKTVGPNNEVYLGKNNAIAFKLVVEGELPTSIDIGAKIADGTSATMCYAVSTSAEALALPSTGRTLTACTALYYPLSVSEWGTDKETGKPCIYVAVKNTGSGILSLTDVKFGYSTAQQADAINFRIDRRMMTSLGLIESNKPVLDEDLTFNMDIVAGAEMVVNYNFMASTVAEYEDFYLEVKKNVAGGEPIVTTFGISEGHTQMGSMNHPTTGEALLYNASYNGINAKEMGDSFATTLYAIDANGKIYKGETVVRSIKDFLMGKLEAETSSAELKTMSVDMLKYGAAAQINFNYDVGNLVTNELSEDQLALATQTIPEATDYASESGTGANVKMNITVNSKVELALSCIAAGQTNPAGVKCVITDADGKVLAELATTNIGGVMYSAKYDNVGAREMRKVITATFYNAEGTVISKTVNWSVESYVAQVRANSTSTATKIAMVDAMLTYGDSVGAYLTSIGQ